MSRLKEDLIKLGEKHPHLRDNIREVLDRSNVDDRVSSRQKSSVPHEEAFELYDRLERVMKSVFERCEPLNQTKEEPSTRSVYDIEVKGDDCRGDVDLITEGDDVKEIKIEFHDPKGKKHFGEGRISLPQNHFQPSEKSLRNRLQGLKGRIKRQINEYRTSSDKGDWYHRDL